MPVHDSMYTHSVATKLQKVVSSETNQELYESLEAVKEKALEASGLSARAAVNMFDILAYAARCDDPNIREAAEKILASQYNVEIA